MTPDTITAIALFLFTLISSIIGYFIRRIIKQLDTTKADTQANTEDLIELREKQNSISNDFSTFSAEIKNSISCIDTSIEKKLEKIATLDVVNELKATLKDFTNGLNKLLLTVERHDVRLDNLEKNAE